MSEEKDELHEDKVEGGNYDVIRNRLAGLGRKLQEQTQGLNEQRQETFGSTELTIEGNERVRTENNCIPVDIVQVGNSLLFGYNVFLGLKKQTVTEDVFSYQTFERTDEGFAFHAVAEDSRLHFLQDRTFQREFDELYSYYKDARLIQLRVTDSKLLAVFQTGATHHDVKVLRWGVDPGGRITYIDNRGERDHVYPPTHDFEWQETSRSDHILGQHPHVNVLDTVFVETVGGDLTVKVEDNTGDGEGIYNEPVDDPNQSLDDARILYAKLGSLIVLRVKPRDEAWRHLVFNVNTRNVVRIDTIGQSCVSLPEDHGILFPGGYYLRTGEYKVFDSELKDLEFVRSIPSPNGEDILYVFHRRSDGLYQLYPYNLIRKEVTNPISANGYSLFDDGTLIVFRGTAEATRVHPMQVWKTPFVSAEFHESVPSDGTLMSRIGNRDLVRGISDAFTLVRLIGNQSPTRQVYEELVAACNRMIDAYYWVSDDNIGLKPLIEEVRRTAERIIDEFVKVQQLKTRAKEVIKTAQLEHDKLLTDVRPEYFKSVQEFLAAMTGLRRHRGELITLKETRYVDVEVLDKLEAQTIERFDEVSASTVTYLLGDGAFKPLMDSLDDILKEVEATKKASELKEPQEGLNVVTEGVNLLGEVVAGLDVEDPTQKTVILEGISEVVANANRVRAVLDGKRRSLRSNEGQAEFAAQFKLFGQSVASSLALCDTPENTDEQLSRMLLQLEELEARFSEFDDFLPQLADKREEVYEAFSARKATLLEARQRRIGSILTAADRILGGVQRRAKSFASEEELAAWFAADPMVMKLRSLAENLTELGDTVKSDELQSKLKSARQDALRALRDKIDLFDGDDNAVKFGKHRFSVNTQPLELTLVPHGDGGLATHLTGTDYTEPITDVEFLETKPYWSQSVVSETAEVYRGEYLAYCILEAAERGEHGLTLVKLDEAILSEELLLETVRTFAADRYEEGYDRGIHDADAAKIIASLIALRKTADLLRFGSKPRALAALFLALAAGGAVAGWSAEARALVRLRETMGPVSQLASLATSIREKITAFRESEALPFGPDYDADAALFLLEVLSREPAEVPFSHPAEALTEALHRWLEDHGGRTALERSLEPLSPARRFTVLVAHTELLAAEAEEQPEVAWEAAALELVRQKISVHITGGDARSEVRGLLGRHGLVKEGTLHMQLDTFLARLKTFREVRVPGYKNYRAARQDLVDRERHRLRLEEFEPRVMTSFVRNKLINDVYLHLVGDNLAKQIGATGAGKRTDLMGLLLLISPPGYGKTTLMEYIASRLGLTFVKVNGPALGHEVASLDPAEAPNATARQEVEKVNLGLEMGNNVMLYLDDIQHCNPEFLQKFISLCDGQRRIEGVWNGRTRTYDMRGKKFAVVMAGNPYTETGEKFQIPDMLANRADTYNLGDILGDSIDKFALSFLENALTSSPVLAPLAARPQADVYKLVRMAQGEEIPASELSHDYSAVELNDIIDTFKHLFECQKALLAVNAEYIRSASMEDSYRTEPRFQLQGSYRNMAKLAEKVLPAMNQEEVVQLITDHYTGEAQTLTTGAESNLLKLAELRGMLTDEQRERWEKIREDFGRIQLMGGDDDPASKISGVLSGVAKELGGISKQLVASSEAMPKNLASLDTQLVGIREALTDRTGVEAIASALAERSADAQTIASGLAPIAAAVQQSGSPELEAKIEALGGTLTEGNTALTEAMQNSMATIASAFGAPQEEIDLTPLLTELAAIRELLASRPDPTLAPTPSPTKRRRSLIDPNAATPVSAAPRITPEEVLRKTRERMIHQAEEALTHDVPMPINDGDPKLAAALGVIEELTVAMSQAAKSRLPVAQHNAFLEDLKRSVAGAVNNLASKR